MNETIEALITTDLSPSHTCNVWDIQTGTIIHSYKNGGVCSPNTLTQINNDYILTGENLKPILHLWQLNSQEPAGKNTIRLVLPGNVTSLDVSPNGVYCAAGIEEKLYIWQLSTGKLLTVISKHFQPITKVKFTKDGSHLITAGMDSLVLIWPLVHLIATQIGAQLIAGQTDPLYTISDHSMPVKDISIGVNRLISVSSDRTLKLYNINSGGNLLSIVFDSPLTCTVLNNAENRAFVGSSNGQILEVDFLNPPRNNQEIHHNDKQTFSGHSKSVTCLSITLDDSILVSGSSDELVIVWHVPTKQKLRIIPHKGPVTNLRFTVLKKNVFVNQDFKPTSVVQSFNRNVSQDDDDDAFVPVIHNSDLMLSSKYLEDDPVDVRRIQLDDGNLQDEVNRLKNINAKLYKFALDHVLNKITKTV